MIQRLLEPMSAEVGRIDRLLFVSLNENATLLRLSMQSVELPEIDGLRA